MCGTVVQHKSTGEENHTWTNSGYREGVSLSGWVVDDLSNGFLVGWLAVITRDCRLFFIKISLCLR